MRWVREEFGAAMVRHGLVLGDYLGDRFDSEGALVGFTGKAEEGELV